MSRQHFAEPGGHAACGAALRKTPVLTRRARIDVSFPPGLARVALAVEPGGSCDGICGTPRSAR